MTRRIAIIGGGLSGTLTAVHLLRRAQAGDLEVVMINRSGPLARGVAYGTRSADHVLNVPAARMSAFDDEPEHFLRFVQTRDAALHGGSFVRRELYGDYLESLLLTEQGRPAQAQRFTHLVGDVRQLELTPGGATLKIGDEAPLQVDSVVLALGNFAPADPRLGDMLALKSPCYVRDPWAADALQHIKPEESLLLLGSGLTMIDIALALQSRGHHGPMLALSRRGLLPQPHRSGGAAPMGITLPSDLLAGPVNLQQWVGLIRKQCRVMQERGIDWRETLASLRAATPELWQRLDDRQRAQFLRHLQPQWDVHRHRLAPMLSERLQLLLKSEGLRVRAGRLLALRSSEGGLAADYRPRCGSETVTAQVGHVINCTGPSTDLRRGEPLLLSLLTQGLATPDALGLGMLTDDGYALLDAQGRPSPVLRYIGPFLRARYWECTAVPELRGHAQRLAEALATDNRL